MAPQAVSDLTAAARMATGDDTAEVLLACMDPSSAHLDAQLRRDVLARPEAYLWRAIACVHQGFRALASAEGLAGRFLERALEDALIVLGLAPGNERALYCAACAERGLGRPDRALLFLEFLLPNSPRARLARALILCTRAPERLPGVLAELPEEQHPWQCLVLRAMAHQAAGRRADAQQALDAADAIPLNQRGRVTGMGPLRVGKDEAQRVRVWLGESRSRAPPRPPPPPPSPPPALHTDGTEVGPGGGDPTARDRLSTLDSRLSTLDSRLVVTWSACTLMTRRTWRAGRRAAWTPAAMTGAGTL